MMAEPITLATDYALAVANACFGIRLQRLTGSAPRLWSAGFIALAVAAFTGGSYHGLGAVLDPRVMSMLWQATEFAIGIGSLCLLLAVVELYTAGRWRVALRILACAKFLIYVVWVSGSDEYIYAVYDSGGTLVVSTALAAIALRLWHHRAARWLLAGYGVSVLAALVQISGLRLHEHFNHNDIYHLIQLIAMTLLFRAGLDFNIAVKALPPETGVGMQ